MISGTFNFMIVFQAEHNILMHPFHMLGVAGVFGGSLFSAMHGSLVTSSLIRETTENESANNGYAFGQEEETYNIVATPCAATLNWANCWNFLPQTRQLTTITEIFQLMASNSPRRKYTPAEIDRWRQLRKQGMTFKAISEKLDVPESSVKLHVPKSNVTVTPPDRDGKKAYSDAIVESWRVLHVDHKLSPTEISRQTGVNIQTIISNLTRLGVLRDTHHSDDVVESWRVMHDDQHITVHQIGKLTGIPSPVIRYRLEKVTTINLKFRVTPEILAYWVRLRGLGMSYSQMATEVGRPSSTIKLHLSGVVIPPLTHDEATVAQWLDWRLNRRMTPAAIAREACVSPKTVTDHLNPLLQERGVRRLPKTNNRVIHPDQGDNLYLILMHFPSGDLLKIGRTIHSIEKRHPLQDFTIVKAWAGRHADVKEIEGAFKLVYAPYARRGPVGFCGRTECFAPTAPRQLMIQWVDGDSRLRPGHGLSHVL